MSKSTSLETAFATSAASTASAKLAFFGSVLRDDFGPASDVDVLVEFEPGHTPGLEFFAMEAELGEILGRKVDLLTPHFLSRHFRDQAIAEAEVQYVSP